MAAELTLEPRRTAWALARVVLFLDAVYAATQFPVRVLGWNHRNVLFWLFDLNKEYNIPSLYSGAALLLCALLLARTAGAERRGGRPHAAWAGLSLAFAFLAADETLVIHERLNEPLRAFLGSSGGALHYAWIVPYAALTAVFAVLYIPFLLRLPARTRGLFVLSGAVFVAGAVGCELAGNIILMRGAGTRSVAMGIQFLVEESLEMLGVVLFLYALLSHMQAEVPDASRRLSVRGLLSGIF